MFIVSSINDFFLVWVEASEAFVFYPNFTVDIIAWICFSFNELLSYDIVLLCPIGLWKLYLHSYDLVGSIIVFLCVSEEVGCSYLGEATISGR